MRKKMPNPASHKKYRGTSKITKYFLKKFNVHKPPRKLPANEAYFLKKGLINLNLQRNIIID